MGYGEYCYLNLSLKPKTGGMQQAEPAYPRSDQNSAGVHPGPRNNQRARSSQAFPGNRHVP